MGDIRRRDILAAYPGGSEYVVAPVYLPWGPRAYPILCPREVMVFCSYDVAKNVLLGKVVRLYIFLRWQRRWKLDVWHRLCLSEVSWLQDIANGLTTKGNISENPFPPALFFCR